MTHRPAKDVPAQEVNFESKSETLPATLFNSAPVGVVLCPPHPLHGGSRNDPRLVRVARELSSHGVSALCIDYGSYGKGVKEVQNVLDAISFMRKRIGRLGLFGYSFGAVVASNAAAQARIDGFASMSILRKVNSLKARLDFDCPKLFVQGRLDAVAPYWEFEQLYAEAKEPKDKLVLDVSHFYMEDYANTMNLVSKRMREFFEEVLLKSGRKDTLKASSS